MAKEKFGVAVDEAIVREVDELVAECDDLGAAWLRDRRNHPHSIHSIRVRPRKPGEKSLFGKEMTLSDFL